MKKIAILISAICALPSIALADPIRVEYEAVVTSGGGSYSVGDVITGWLEYDSDDLADCAGGDYVCSLGPVTSSTGDGGYAIEDDYALVCSPSVDPATCVFENTFLWDGSYEYTGETEGVESGFYHLFDFYPGGGMTSYGYIWNYVADYVCGDDGCVYTYQVDDFITFEVTRMQEVPEPATLALFGMGLLAVGAARRKRKNS